MPDHIVVTVYTAPACPACQATKRHLNRQGILFDEVPLDSDEGIRAAAIELGCMAAPVVCASTPIGEQTWDGYRPDRIDALKVPVKRERERGLYEDLTIRDRGRSQAQSRLIGGMPSA